MSSDIVTFCTLFKSLGFNVKSVTPCETAKKNDGKGVSVEFSCHRSGLRIEMQLDNVFCTCPSVEETVSSSMWQISGTSGGVSVSNKDSTILQHLSKNMTDFVKKRMSDLLDIVNTQSETKKNFTSTPKQRRFSISKEIPEDIYAKRRTELNESSITASLSSLNVTPPKLFNLSKPETPSRYRSLDTLTNLKQSDEIPKPGALIPKPDKDLDLESEKIEFEKMIRQNTFAEPEVFLTSENTNSAANVKTDPVPHRLIKAENVARELLSIVHDVNEILNNRRVPDPDNSGVSIALDISKISAKKPPHQGAKHLSIPKSRLSLPFSSHPNLSTDRAKCNLKRTISVSSQKIPKPIGEIGASSRRTATPTFGRKKESIGTVAGSTGSITGSYKSLPEKTATAHQSGGAFPKAALKITSPKPATTKPSPNTADSQLKRKSNLYNHIKSTIPRATSSIKKTADK